tara:strand:- start:20694 stop:22223 length:1530 start_codon:yes stop_codon:yes gene_type:complete
MKVRNNTLIPKFLIFLPLFIYFGKRSVVAYDEGFYAIQARWILEKGNWIAPMWWDSITNDRTIGIQFLLALSRNIFGNSLFALYLPIFVFSILMLFATYHLHKELLNDHYSFYSPIILSSTFLWISYSNMATQDMVFASIISCGILSTIKAFKTNRNIYYLLSGIWIGLAVMLKTYLTVIPLVAITPFLLSSKIIYKKYFWIGLIIGFFPFLIWTYKYISLYGYSIYGGIYKKLINLSEKNNFSKSNFYYLWNFSINIFPWTFLSIIGFLQSFKMDSLKKYFLFFYPIFVIILLSLFSTKTPYYPLQILSLTSINSFLGIKYIIEKDHKNVIFYLEKINFILIPLILILGIMVFNFTNLIVLDMRAKIFMTIGFSLFSLSWIIFSLIKNKKIKLNLSIIGPYLLIIMLVQSGLITDKSKELRTISEELIKSENLSKTPIFIDRSYSDDNADSKIIKIMMQMPKLGKSINKLEELSSRNFVWTTSNKFSENYELINSNKVFYPWKLLLKK